MKRGAISLLLVVKMGLILSLLVFFILAGAANLIVDEDRLARLATARDAALLIDTVQAVPFDVGYEYPVNTLNSKLIIENYIVTSVGIVDGVQENPDNVITKRGFSTHHLAEINMPVELDSPFFSIIKDDDVLTIQEGFIGDIDLSQEQFTREGLVFSVVIDDERLESLKLILENRLEDAGFVVGENPTKLIYLVVGEKNQVYYSRLKSYETKQLGEELQTVMIDFSLETSEHALSKDYPNAGFGFEFIEEDLDTLNKELFSTVAVDVIGKYYVEWNVQE